MGASEFYIVMKGTTAREAFNDARDDALYEWGHGGYTGSIAEKDTFVMIPLPDDVDAEDYAYSIVDDHPKLDGKWGPAGCFRLDEDTFAFFGTASS